MHALLQGLQLQRLIHGTICVHSYSRSTVSSCEPPQTKQASSCSDKKLAKPLSVTPGMQLCMGHLLPPWRCAPVQATSAPPGTPPKAFGMISE